MPEYHLECAPSTSPPPSSSLLFVRSSRLIVSPPIITSPRVDIAVLSCRPSIISQHSFQPSPACPSRPVTRSFLPSVVAHSAPAIPFTFPPFARSFSGCLTFSFGLTLSRDRIAPSPRLQSDPALQVDVCPLESRSHEGRAHPLRAPQPWPINHPTHSHLYRHYRRIFNRIPISLPI